MATCFMYKDGECALVDVESQAPHFKENGWTYNPDEKPAEKPKVAPKKVVREKVE